MIFKKQEKVFSLSKATATIPFGNITALFEEFYCYLMVAGFFREGESTDGIHFTIPEISNDNFDLPSGAYHSQIARSLTKGLRLRHKALSNHPDLLPTELNLLQSLDYIFSDEKSWYINLTGRSLLSVAFSRGFSPDMKAIAHYVAVTFGQFDYPTDVEVPRLYLSAFGDLHLAKPDAAQESGYTDHSVIINPPLLKYGTKASNGDTVTALWSFLSAQITTMVNETCPGNYLGNMLSNLLFLSENSQFDKAIPAPRYASSLYMQRIMGLDSYNPVSLSTLFYRDFLYGSLEKLSVSRQFLLVFILDVMMEKMGAAHLGHLFSDNSYYGKLTTTSTIYANTPKRAAILQFALESLDDDLAEQVSADLATGDDVTPEGNGGYDPSVPPPAVPINTTAEDKDTIDLISFDKSGEGVNEDLYRTAVVALNDRLQGDDSIPVTAAVRDSLDYWVNGFLYRTAISETKDQITFLNLHQYLKNVSTKG